MSHTTFRPGNPVRFEHRGQRHFGTLLRVQRIPIGEWRDVIAWEVRLGTGTSAWVAQRLLAHALPREQE